MGRGPFTIHHLWCHRWLTRVLSWEPIDSFPLDPPLEQKAFFGMSHRESRPCKPPELSAALSTSRPKS